MPDDRPLDGCSVLMVDDDPDALRLYGLALSRAGADVTHAPTGEAAVADLAAGARYHVAVVDLVLPGMRGTEVVARVRAGGFRGALVGLSAYLTPEVTELWYAAGCDAVLPKAGGLDEIVKTVGGLCQTFDRTWGE